MFSFIELSSTYKFVSKSVEISFIWWIHLDNCDRTFPNEQNTLHLKETPPKQELSPDNFRYLELMFIAINQKHHRQELCFVQRMRSTVQVIVPSEAMSTDAILQKLHCFIDVMKLLCSVCSFYIFFLLHRACWSMAKASHSAMPPMPLNTRNCFWSYFDIIRNRQR